MSDITGGNFYFVFHILILSQAACHKERHVSQKAVSFIHDVLTEVLTSWAELPHFHFNEALFRPFEHIMQLELCDEDVQDQVNLDSPKIKFTLYLHQSANHSYFNLAAGGDIDRRAGGDVFSSDPVWMEASVQRSEDCPQQQDRH